VRKDQMVIRKESENENSHSKSKGEEGKEMLRVSSKEV